MQEVKEANTTIEKDESGAIAKSTMGDNVRELSPEEREERIAQFTKVLEEKTAQMDELKEKVYLVKGGQKTVNGILFFMENYAQWQYTEAMGIVEVTKIIRGKSESIIDEKDELFLNSLELEALFYYMRKSGGTGLTEATEFIDEVSPIINPIIETLNNAAAEKKRVEDEINQAQMDLASAEQGIEVLDEPETETETEKQ